MSFLTKKSKAKRVRLFFATDLHGSEPTFRKFINVVNFYNIENLILGGDVTGKLIAPIIALGNNKYRTTHQSATYTFHSEEELSAFKKTLGTLGYYSIMVSEDEYKHLANNPAEIEQLYFKKGKERLASWVQLAEERLAGTQARCYITGGNDDSAEVLETLYQEAREHVIPCEDKIVSVGDDGHTMVSFGYSNPTPWNTPRELEEKELAQLIDKAVEDIEDFSRVIFNFHAPPIDSMLDTCPQLDTSTDPPTVITSGGEPVMFGAGSSAVREAIVKYKPLLGLHGHIHESRDIRNMGRTVIVNPGSEYGEGILRGVIVTLNGNEVESTQMTSG